MWDANRWNVHYWDDTDRRWYVGLTTGHRESAEQLAAWLREIGWQSRIDEGTAPERFVTLDSREGGVGGRRFWHAAPEASPRPHSEAEAC